MCMHKIELFFSDYCKYLCIPENIFSLKQTRKILVRCSRIVNSNNFENKLIFESSKHRFLSHGGKQAFSSFDFLYDT